MTVKQGHHDKQNWHGRGASWNAKCRLFAARHNKNWSEMSEGERVGIRRVREEEVG